jgi:hypothetical protein
MPPSPFLLSSCPFPCRQVLEAIDETGIPYAVLQVPFQQPTGSAAEAELFASIVGAMSRTGILIGAHDASLMNAAFLPAHAVLVEMYPAGIRRPTYRYLAEAAVSHGCARSGLRWPLRHGRRRSL